MCCGLVCFFHKSFTISLIASTLVPHSSKFSSKASLCGDGHILNFFLTTAKGSLYNLYAGHYLAKGRHWHCFLPEKLWLIGLCGKMPLILHEKTSLLWNHSLNCGESCDLRAFLYWYSFIIFCTIYNSQFITIYRV